MIREKQAITVDELRRHWTLATIDTNHWYVGRRVSETHSPMHLEPVYGYEVAFEQQGQRSKVKRTATPILFLATPRITLVGSYLLLPCSSMCDGELKMLAEILSAAETQSGKIIASYEGQRIILPGGEKLA